ncbi:cytochrome c1 [Shewanella sp. YIC-542]|uniref:cytochrome c1 n=1 Tax=Shewanella mytili TaxID=3377111 RepID=UPI00398E8934
MRYVLSLLLLFSALLQAEEGMPPLPADLGQAELPAMQRGLAAFQRHCASCHSTHYQRYNQVATDLQISAAQMNAYIMTGAKPFELMENAMSKKEAARWFGMAPPDLTLVARVRGEAWLYRFLHGFYRDAKRPFGVNNLQSPYTTMPHVLEDLQGIAEPLITMDKGKDKPKAQVTGVQMAQGGQLSPEEYDRLVRDLISYLTYTAEPMKQQRQAIGQWVMAFLLFFLLLVWLLKKEYWKDVH